jgi:hypothetical protein
MVKKELHPIDFKDDNMTSRRKVHAKRDVKCALLGGNLPTNTYPGFLRKNPTTRIQIKEANPTSRIWKKEARFTMLQYFLWQSWVYKPYEKGLIYSFQGRANCQSWTAFALRKAKIVGKIPLYP